MSNQHIARRALVALTVGSAIMLTARPVLADDAIASEARDAVTRMGKTLATGAFSFEARTIWRNSSRSRVISATRVKISSSTSPKRFGRGH